MSHLYHERGAKFGVAVTREPNPITMAVSSGHTTSYPRERKLEYTAIPAPYTPNAEASGRDRTSAPIAKPTARNPEAPLAARRFLLRIVLAPRHRRQAKRSWRRGQLRFPWSSISS